jgi:hypothetical protein
MRTAVTRFVFFFLFSKRIAICSSQLAVVNAENIYIDNAFTTDNAKIVLSAKDVRRNLTLNHIYEAVYMLGINWFATITTKRSVNAVA